MTCRSSVACLAALAALTIAASALADEPDSTATDQTRCGAFGCGAIAPTGLGLGCGCGAPIAPAVAVAPCAIPMPEPMVPVFSAVQAPPMVFPGICVPDTTITIPGISVPGFAIPGPTVPVLAGFTSACGCGAPGAVAVPGEPGYAGPEGAPPQEGAAPGPEQAAPGPEQAPPSSQPTH